MKFRTMQLLAIAAVIYTNGITAAEPLKIDADKPAAEAKKSDIEEWRALGVSPVFEETLARETLHAIDIGVQWLEAGQQENGCWSSPKFPASTGLAVTAILRSPAARHSGKRSAAVERGLKFILTCLKKDGGIYEHVPGIKGGGLPNYNTALCLSALHEARMVGYCGVVEGARGFLVRGQHKDNDVFNGGMGYDASTKRPYTDMSNTFFALEALRLTAPDEMGESQHHPDWQAALDFLRRCQHRRDAQPDRFSRLELRPLTQPYLEKEFPDAEGGFVYHPRESKAGSVLAEDGVTSHLLAYGSITCAGLTGLLNCGADRQSPEVQKALGWIVRHWSLDENPTMGEQSLYYYYHAMTTALNAYGDETLELPKKGKILWRPALAKKIVTLQRIDPKTGLGYWKNDNNRYWEADPNLATCYALLALEKTLLGGAPPKKTS